ncbi:glycosyltransferase family 2 protein [Burkholderia sp. ABCPW 11]|uniref:glycosyltransferase family 2 protein n=1 Tax=Burkholderia sp. ABCPW 11 TaxID=1637859 RepID=UPI00211D20E3|nr:glycosyltransferase family 2 protein [Burkholderia sp. ABCPW 11]
MPAQSIPFIRRTFLFKLAPMQDVAIDNTRPNTWTSIGTDPTFELIPIDGTYPRGWVYMQSSLVRRGAQLQAQLFVDSGSGFSEAECIVIPTTRPGNIKHVFKLPPTVRALRWIPMRGKGVIVQQPIVMTAITEIERVVRMAEWVASDIWKFRKTNQAKQYSLKTRRIFFDLLGAYEDCAKLRIHSAPPSYQTFIDNYTALSNADEAAIRSHIAQFSQKPRISIVMPTFNPPLGYLKEAIDSVRNQLYSNWELCIADDCSTASDVRPFLTSLPAIDSRIKVHFRDVNGHISAASNSALAIAEGSFVALLDQDDLLPKHALYHVALEINRFPDANVIYSDEDKIDNAGNRSDPYFKSDWNPDLFLSHNMISHLGVYRASLLREIGGFRIGYEGSQDYDLALRCVRASRPAQIRHIPHVLYHWRLHDESTAANPNAKHYAYDAALRAIQDFLSDKPGARVEHGHIIGTYRVIYPIPERQPQVSILIPTRNGRNILKQCIESILRKTKYKNYEIVVVNNQSTCSETISYLKRISNHNKIRVINYDAPFNYSAINNFAEKHATGEIIGLLNDDVEVVSPDWLNEMVSQALRPEVGVVGAKLLYSDGFVQHAGVVIGIGGFAGHAHRLHPGTHPGYAGRAILTQNFSAVTAACLVVRRSVYRELGGFNEQDLTVAFNDVDFCLRAGTAGYHVTWTPYAVLYHHESYSRGSDQASAESRARLEREKNYMRARWKTDSKPDRFYNPNLTLEKEDFTLAHRPRGERPWLPFVKK